MTAFRLLVDALVGNTTMDVLDVSENAITCIRLDDITRLLASTRVRSIQLHRNVNAFGNEASTRRLARVLSRHAFLTNFGILGCRLGGTGIHIIADGLAGNTVMTTLDIGQNRITSPGSNIRVGATQNDAPCWEQWHL
jgi:Ran GTPase-activating protein (RanGAP) involved in mRNA processing and transport